MVLSVSRFWLWHFMWDPNHCKVQQPQYPLHSRLWQQSSHQDDKFCAFISVWAGEEQLVGRSVHAHHQKNWTLVAFVCCPMLSQVDQTIKENTSCCSGRNQGEDWHLMMVVERQCLWEVLDGKWSDDRNKTTSISTSTTRWPHNGYPRLPLLQQCASHCASYGISKLGQKTAKTAKFGHELTQWPTWNNFSTLVFALLLHSVLTWSTPLNGMELCAWESPCLWWLDKRATRVECTWVTAKMIWCFWCQFWWCTCHTKCVVMLSCSVSLWVSVVKWVSWCHAWVTVYDLFWEV